MAAGSGPSASSRLATPQQYDNDDANSALNRETIGRMAKGYTLPEYSYEFGSCHRDIGQSTIVVNPQQRILDVESRAARFTAEVIEKQERARSMLEIGVESVLPPCGSDDSDHVGSDDNLPQLAANDEKADSSEEEEDEETIDIETLPLARQCALVRLLDNEQLEKEHDLQEMIERMKEIDTPESQLPVLLEWALRHRSAMGCTLAARIIKSWSQLDARAALFMFMLNARPPPPDKEPRRKSGERGETAEARFIRTLSRLFVALSHEQLVTYGDLQKAIELKKQHKERGSESGYSLDALLAVVPIVDRRQRRQMERDEESRGGKKGVRRSKRGKEMDKGADKEELWQRTSALLKRLSSGTDWYAPLSDDDEREARLIVEAARSLPSCRDAYDLAVRASETVLGLWREDGGGEESEEKAKIGKKRKRKEIECSPPSAPSISAMPSRSALHLLCQLAENTVDSSLLPRFLLESLPHLHSLAQRSPQLAVYSSTATLFLTAKCFHSHLTLAAMGCWPQMREQVATLVQSLCPLHWQTRRLAQLFGTARSQAVCSMAHGGFPSDPEQLAIVEKEVMSGLEALLEREWTEMGLITVADRVGDQSTELDIQSLREWWRQRLLTQIKAKQGSSEMLRLLVLSVYRGVIDAEDTVERAIEGLRAEDAADVETSLAVLNALLVGGSNRCEEELLVEGAIGSELLGRAIGELLWMSCKHSSDDLRDRASTILGRHTKRQYVKRVAREEEGEAWRREECVQEESVVEAYRQLSRKCAPTGWPGLALTGSGGGEEKAGAGGSKGLRALSVMDADAARREMQWALVKEQASGGGESAEARAHAAAILDALGGESSSGTLAYLLLAEMRKDMVEAKEHLPAHATAYRSLATALLETFTTMLITPERLPSPPSSLFVSTVQLAWRDADERAKEQLRAECRTFLGQWKERECADNSMDALITESIEEYGGRIEELTDFDEGLFELEDLLEDAEQTGGAVQLLNYESSHLLLVARLTVSCCLSEKEEGGGAAAAAAAEWADPFYELLRLRMICPEKDRELFLRVLRMLERIEQKKEKGKESQVMSMYHECRPIEEILRFLRSLRRVEENKQSDKVEPMEKNEVVPSEAAKENEGWPLQVLQTDRQWMTMMDQHGMMARAYLA